MITERPLLTIRREFPRPEAKSVGRFAGAATVHLVDAIGGCGALGRQIKAVSRTAATFAGPALTCMPAPTTPSPFSPPWNWPSPAMSWWRQPKNSGARPSPATCLPPWPELAESQR